MHLGWVWQHAVPHVQSPGGQCGGPKHSIPSDYRLCSIPKPCLGIPGRVGYHAGSRGYRAGWDIMPGAKPSWVGYRAEAVRSRAEWITETEQDMQERDAVQPFATPLPGVALGMNEPPQRAAPAAGPHSIATTSIRTADRNGEGAGGWKSFRARVRAQRFRAKRCTRSSSNTPRSGVTSALQSEVFLGASAQREACISPRPSWSGIRYELKPTADPAGQLAHPPVMHSRCPRGLDPI